MSRLWPLLPVVVVRGRLDVQRREVWEAVAEATCCADASSASTKSSLSSLSKSLREYGPDADAVVPLESTWRAAMLDSRPASVEAEFGRRSDSSGGPPRRIHSDAPICVQRGEQHVNMRTESVNTLMKCLTYPGAVGHPALAVGRPSAAAQLEQRREVLVLLVLKVVLAAE
jgi:hypothetical protein